MRDGVGVPGDKFIILTVSIKQEDNVWLARCIELGTSMYGDTFEEAHSALHEAIGLHLKTLEDVKECARFLKENSVKIYGKYPKNNTAKRKIDVMLGEFVSRDVTQIPEPAFC